MTGGMDFNRELLEKVKGLGESRRKSGAPIAPGMPRAGRAFGPKAKLSGRNKPIKLRARAPGAPKPGILVVGSSTGGPQALFELFKGLKGAVDVPIVVTQHMPPTFTTILAEHINRSTGVRTTEAKEGDVLEPGHILLAPGDYHMNVIAKGVQKVIRLTKDPPENFCRPAVDPMLRSVIKAYGNRVLVVMLTGMGYDGLKGAKSVTEAGGTVIAQDEDSSVVWGMPGAVAEAGICEAVLPLKEIARHVTTIL
jgi:two-component system chemotaxis response regulator CheB